MHVMWSLRGEIPVFIPHGENVKLKLTIILTSYKGYYFEEDAIEALLRHGVVGGHIQTTTTILKELKCSAVVEDPLPPSTFVSSLSTPANADEWKFIKELVGLLLIVLNALVVVVIAVVVKLYIYIVRCNHK